MFSTGFVNRQLIASLLVFSGAAIVVGAAIGFERIGGFIPCKMCLLQREPYYAALPVSAFAAFSAWRNWPACVSRGLLFASGLLMFYTLTLGVQQSGMEWGFWEGPKDCSATGAQHISDAGNMLEQLDTKPPACDEAAGRFLGLSFAGWNVVGAFGLALIAFWGAITSPKTATPKSE